MGVTRRVTWLSGMVLANLLLAGQAAAVTLGDLVVKSEPGESLRAVIPLTLEPDESLAELQVTLASQSAYTLQNMTRPALFDGMQIALLSTGENRGRIQFFGSQPWHGEAAVMLLELNWPQGQMARRFRIAPVEVNKAAEEATPLYVEVGPNDSLADIAIRLSEHSNRSYLHMMVALYRANPDAFYRDNLNNLKSGVRLRVPTSEELYQLSDAEVFSTLREHKQRWQADTLQAKQKQEEAARLEQQLQQVTQNNAEIEQRNEELKERLARLEKQINSMSKQVLDYEVPQKTTETPVKTDQSKLEEVKMPPADKSAPEEPAVKQQASSGLSATWMVLLMLVVAAVVAAIWRYAPRRDKGGS